MMLMNYKSTEKIINLGLLYISKSGGLIVGLMVLPLYQQMLGAEAFGVVAIILSLQSFLLMIDLGTSTLVGREIAVSQKPGENYGTWCAAQWLLHTFYLGLLLLAIILNLCFDNPLPTKEIFLSAIFFWSLTVQNLSHSALLAMQNYAVAGILQFVGVLSRAAITLAAMTYISAELKTFLFYQAIAAVAQMVLTSWICKNKLYSEEENLVFTKITHRMFDLAKRGSPLIIFGLSGAAVLQLDKIIIPIFISPAALAPYFLATAISLTSVNILAGPISQYYFPKIIESINKDNSDNTLKKLNKFSFCICLVVAIPSSILWLWREPIINTWLHFEPIAIPVAQYVKILLPFVSLGVLGYVPYNILISHQDYRLHSIISAGMAVTTLSATLIAAYIGSTVAVCWVYAIYHSFSVVFIWCRASYVVAKPIDNYATRSAYYAIFMVVFIFFLVYCINLAIKLIGM